MKANSTIFNPHPQMGYSDVYSVGSLDNQIKEIQSVYYRFGKNSYTSLQSKFFKSGECLKNLQSQKDSLQLSNSPNKNSVDHDKKLFSFQRINQHEEKKADSSIKCTFPEQKLHEEINQFLNIHQRFLHRTPFSAIPLFNPAFKRFQQIKKSMTQKSQYNIVINRNENNEGLFYPMPPNQLLEIRSLSTNQCHKQSMLISEQEIISPFDLKQNYQFQIKNRNQSKQEKDQFDKVYFLNECQQKSQDLMKNTVNKKQDLQQQKNKIANNLNEKKLQQKIGSMNYNQVYEEVMKHLRIMEDINNSQISIISQNSSKATILSKKSISNSQIIKKQPQIEKNKYNLPKECNQGQERQKIMPNFNQKSNKKDKSQNNLQNILSESKYLKSSFYSLTLSQKKEIIKKFNEEQQKMMKKMIQSITMLKQEQRKLYNNQKIIEQNQERNYMSYPLNQYNLNMMESQKSFKKLNLSEIDIKKKRATFNPILKTQINSQYSSQDKYLRSESKLNENQINSGNVEFQKLQNLMKDPQMKKSIVDSLGLDSSNNSHSFISILDKELAISKSREE